MSSPDPSVMQDMAAPTYGSGAVVTPEAVRLDFHAAGVGSRGIALLLDWLVLGVVVFIVNFAVGLLVATDGLGLSDTAGIVVLLVVNFLVIFGYPVALETLWHGRTLGKAALGLRVVTVDGAPVRFRHAAIRAALQLIDLYVFTGVPGVISMLVTRRHQRLGDLAAGTMVLRERIASGTVQAARFDVPYGLGGYADTVDASGLSVQDYNVLRSFLLRAAQLDPTVRDNLARQLAATFAAKLGSETPPSISVEQFLFTLAARYQQRGAPVQPTAPPGTAPPPPPGPQGQTTLPSPPPVLGDFAPPTEPT